MTKKRLGDLLIDAGLINQLQLRSALAEQERWGKPLGRTLIEMEVVDENEMIQVLSRHLGVPQVNLEQTKLDERAARTLDEAFCREHELVPFAFDEQDEWLDVAMAAPTDPAIFEQIRVKTRRNIRPHLAGPLAIEAAINRIHLGAKSPQAAGAGEGQPKPAAETLFEFGQDGKPAEKPLARLESLEMPIDVTGAGASAPLVALGEPLGDAGAVSLAPLGGTGEQDPVVAEMEQLRAEAVSTEVAHVRADLSDLRQQIQQIAELSAAVGRLQTELTEVKRASQRTDRQLRTLVSHLVAKGVVSPPRQRREPSGEPSKAAAATPVAAPSAAGSDRSTRRMQAVEPPRRPGTGEGAKAEPVPPAAPGPEVIPPPKSVPDLPPAPSAPPPRRGNDLPAVSGTIDVPNVPTGAVVAMDFGTSRSSVATVLNGKIVSVKLGGEWDMPSVVGFAPDTSVILGRAAREMLAHDPRNAVPWPKRLVGRRYRDRELEPYLANMAISYSEGPHGEVLLHARDTTHTVEEVCSHLLKRLRLAAEHTISRPVSEVVLTTPVSFDKPQYDAMREAAKLAGLKVVDFIDEPVAAAFTNRSHPSFQGLVAVYDFGGGTFDFSVVEVSDSDVSVVTSAGDAWLGGDDFDEALANAAANAFWRKTNIELRNQVVEFQRLLIAAEQAKQRLSTEAQTVLKLERAALVSQGALDLEFTVSQGEFARLSQEIIQRSLDTCEEALSLNGIKVTDLNAVYLSGGTSYIPAVREGLARFFGQTPHITVPPERAVILGAALYAAVIDR